MNFTMLTDPNVLRNSGEFISPERAACYLKRFFEFEDPGFAGDPKEHIVSGQVVSLENLKTFVDQIVAYNEDKDEEHEDRIVAVRIYSSISSRAGSLMVSGNPTAPSKELRDLFLEPVLLRGSDYHKKHPSSSGPMANLILGRMLPCPNVCSLTLHCS